MLNLNLPETLTETQACTVLGMCREDLERLIEAKKLTLVKGQLSTQTVGAYLMEVNKWDGDYVEIFIAQALR